MSHAVCSPCGAQTQPGRGRPAETRLHRWAGIGSPPPGVRRGQGVKSQQQRQVQRDQSGRRGRPARTELTGRGAGKASCPGGLCGVHTDQLLAYVILLFTALLRGAGSTSILYKEMKP